MEKRVGNQQSREEHADPCAYHQRDLSKRIDEQVKVQHQSEDGEKEIRHFKDLPEPKNDEEMIISKYDGDLLRQID